MHSTAPAAYGAKRLLSSAARTLRTADPVSHLAPFLDESLSLPAGDPAYRRPHSFETRFSERRPRALTLGMSVGDPHTPAGQRSEGATRAMRYITHHNFGSDALRWLDGRTEPHRSMHGDGWVVSGFDRAGVSEAQVTYSWGPETTASLAPGMQETVARAVEAVPTLIPAFTSVRCGRSYGSQEITFRVDGTLQLAGLRPLMETLGMGTQHARTVNAIAFVLGARFELPPDTTLITLRPASAGIEMRIDVDLEAIPDVPANLASLLQLHLTERPQSQAALEHWVGAMTPEGYISPGSLSVLSVVVRPGSGPKIEIDLRPSVLGEGEPAPVSQPSPAPAPVATPAPVPAAEAGFALSGARSPWDPR